MRLWTLHPRYLDRKGLLALWREALLAQKVLLNRTKGYRNHPQLERFKLHPRPLEAIGFYLLHVYHEGKLRGYNFKKEKIFKVAKKLRPVKISAGQVKFEIKHLAAKLRIRDKQSFIRIMKAKKIKCHPLFVLRSGGKEPWEKHE